jgi:hypothetical protein
VKQGAIVSTHYTQVSAPRTIEDILGTEHINLNTAFQRPMSDVFDMKSNGTWTYTAAASTALAGTAVAWNGRDGGVRFASGPIVTPKPPPDYWDRVTAGFDFSAADQVPPALFNRVLWTGLMGDLPYPEGRAGKITAGGN